MGFSADCVGAELIVVVWAGCDPIDLPEGAVVVGSEVNEQLAIKRATQPASPMMRVGCALRKRRLSSLVLDTFFVWETFIALAQAFSTALITGTRWVDVVCPREA